MAKKKQNAHLLSLDSLHCGSALLELLALVAQQRHVGPHLLQLPQVDPDLTKLPAGRERRKNESSRRAYERSWHATRDRAVVWSLTCC